MNIFPGGEPLADIARDPCDNPGSRCSGAGEGDRFDDPDPVPGPGGNPAPDRFDDPSPLGGPGGAGKGGKGRD
jgi:hypothetical protein